MNGPLIAMLALLGASATFSGAESALFTLASGPRERLPAVARRLLDDPAGVLTIILLSNLVINLAYFAVSAAWAEELSGEAAAGIAIGAVLGLVLVGEILPKVLANRFPGNVGRILLPPIWLMHFASGPVAPWLGRKLSAGSRPPDALDPQTADRLIEEEGSEMLGEEEQALVRHVLELGTLRAGAVRRPLSECVMLPGDMPLSDAREQLLGEGHVWCGVTDPKGEVRGALDLSRSPEGRTAADAMLAVPILPEVGSVTHGIKLLRETQAPFVLLVDEYGDSAGIIQRGRWADTLLDRLPDQHAGHLPAIVPLGAGRFQVDASLPLHVFRERFGDPGEVDPRIDTLGGLLQERLGRVPKAGDQLRIGGYQAGVDVRVVRCQGNAPVEFEVTEVAGNDGTPYTHPRAGSE